MVYLTFASQFNAIHRLWNADLDSDENLRIYGVCANPAGHGHLYRLEVTVGANVTRREPVVLGRGLIRGMIDSVLVPRLQNANLDVAFELPDFVSTGENVVRAIWRIVQSKLPDSVSLVAVRLVETPKNSFVYYGESGHEGFPRR